MRYQRHTNIWNEQWESLRGQILQRIGTRKDLKPDNEYYVRRRKPSRWGAFLSWNEYILWARGFIPLQWFSTAHQDEALPTQPDSGHIIHMPVVETVPSDMKICQREEGDFRDMECFRNQPSNPLSAADIILRSVTLHCRGVFSAEEEESSMKEILEELLAKQGDFKDLLYERNDKGEVVIHLLVGAGRKGLIRRLLQHDSATKRLPTNFRGESPLHYAALFNTTDRACAEMLLKHGAETGDWDLNAQNTNGWTALHFAAHALNTEVLKLLLRHCRICWEKHGNSLKEESSSDKHNHGLEDDPETGLDVNRRCKQGRTPIFYAVRSIQGWKESSDILKSLLDFKNIRLDITDETGVSLAQIAFQHLIPVPEFDTARQINPITLLVKAMVSRKECHGLLLEPLPNGKTPFHIAFELAFHEHSTASEYGYHYGRRQSLSPSYHDEIFRAFIGRKDVNWDVCSSRAGLGGRSLIQYVLEESFYASGCQQFRKKFRLLTSIFNDSPQSIDLQKFHSTSGQTILHYLVAKTDRFLRFGEAQEIFESLVRAYCKLAQHEGLHIQSKLPLDFHRRDRDGYTALHRAFLQCGSSPVIPNLLHICKKGNQDETVCDSSLLELPDILVFHPIKKLISANERISSETWEEVLSTDLLSEVLLETGYYSEISCTEPGCGRLGNPKTLKSRKVGKTTYVMARDIVPRAPLTNEQVWKQILLQAPLYVHAYLQTIRFQSGAQRRRFPRFNDDEAISKYTYKLTPLHYAVLTQSRTLITKLLESDTVMADINTRWGPLKETPLQIASRLPFSLQPPSANSRVRSDSLLLSKRDDIIQALMDGHSELHTCVRNNLGENLRGFPPHYYQFNYAQMPNPFPKHWNKELEWGKYHHGTLSGSKLLEEKATTGTSFGCQGCYLEETGRNASASNDTVN